MLEFSCEQVEQLSLIDQHHFVENVQADLLKVTPALANDPTLSNRLWEAYLEAKRLGIKEDANLVMFLKVEAFEPRFYDKPATRRWLTKPGRGADERFHDFIQVVAWQAKHPGGK